MTSSLIPRRTFIAHLTSVAALAGVAITLSTPALAAGNDAARPTHPHRNVNAVVHWNTIAAETFAPSQGTNPMAQSRTFSILHAAIHDALNAIERRYESHTPGLAPAPEASADVTVAAAAREVLASLVPDQAALVQAAYARSLDTVRNGPAKTAGIATGQAAARATMKRRQGDGSETAAQPIYTPRSGRGEYQFTTPFDFAVQPGWGRVRPFVIDLPEHALEGPLPLTSAQYAGDLAYIKRIGHIASEMRTSDQTEIAKFWYEDSPLGWNRIASTVVRERGLDAWEAARAFALVHFAMADGFIAGFDAKYHYRFWRPLTAIQEAGTPADRNWQPLLTTPPVPDYPSTHTVLGWAAAEVLIDLFGDKLRYSTTSLTLPGVTRHYRGFSQAAQENGMSRLYAGIHFRHAVMDGRRQGRGIGRTVALALQPVH